MFTALYYKYDVRDSGLNRNVVSSNLDAGCDRRLNAVRLKGRPMINPNKMYYPKVQGLVASIDTNAPGYWFTVYTDTGECLEGYLRQGEPNYNKLTLGQRVRFCVQWSITGDHWLVRTVSKVRS
jgi:hypothetical protein